MKTFCHKKEEIQRSWINKTELRVVFTTSVIGLAIGVTKKNNKYIMSINGCVHNLCRS